MHTPDSSSRGLNWGRGWRGTSHSVQGDKCITLLRRPYIRGLPSPYYLKGIWFQVPNHMRRVRPSNECNAGQGDKLLVEKHPYDPFLQLRVDHQICSLLNALLSPMNEGRCSGSPPLKILSHSPRQRLSRCGFKLVLPPIVSKWPHLTLSFSLF